MAVSGKVENALIAYFKLSNNCGDIPFTRATNIYHLCGFDVGGTGWRAIANDINNLPELIAANLCVNPSTTLDKCKSVADIEEILVARPAAVPMAKPVASAPRSMQTVASATRNKAKKASKKKPPKGQKN
jgi:hypothetical protein